MKIAIPTYDGKLCPHFGHCEKFAFVEVDKANKKIISSESVDAPEHVPGAIPPWVAQRGAKLVLAGGMGAREIELFDAAGVQVVSGCPAIDFKALVQLWLDGSLETGENACNHDETDGHHCSH